MALAAPAIAQSPDDRLNALNTFLQRGAASLPATFGNDPMGEARGLDQAQSILAAAKAGMTSDLASSPLYAAVAKNIAALDDRIRTGRLAQSCSQARRSVIDALEQKNAAGAAAALAALTANAKRLKGAKGLEGTLSFFTKESKALEKRLAELRKEIAQPPPPPLVFVPVQVPTASPAPLPPLPPAAVAPIHAELAGVPPALVAAAKAARAARQLVAESLRKGQGPISSKLLDGALASAERVRALDAEFGESVVAQAELLLLENAGRTGVAGQSGSLGALVVRVGQASKTVAFETWEDWCYVVVSPAPPGWRLSLSSNGVQRFRQKTSDNGDQLAGFCSLARMPMEVSTDGMVASSKFTVLGWPREKLPLSVLRHAEVLGADPCDENQWTQAWLRPLPGTILYANGEPVLIIDPGEPAEDSAGALAMNGASRREKKQMLTDVAPANLTINVAPERPDGCPNLGPPVPILPEKSACRAESDTTFEPQLKNAFNALRASTTTDGRLEAERMVRILDDEAVRARTRACSSRDVTATEVFYTRVKDSFQANPPTGLGRARFLLAEHASPLGAL